MKIFLLLFMTMGLAALASCEVARPVQLIRQATRECPPDTLYQIDAYRWMPFAALRFVRDVQALAPTGPLTQRDCDDRGLREQFRFGHLYFIENEPNVAMASNVRLVWCAQGRDTMRVVFFTNPGNVFYDSIPFRSGTFLLSQPWSPSGQTLSTTFADYYTAHSAELARQNVFANMHFKAIGICCRSEYKVPGAPDTPAQIFESVLHATYVRVRFGRLVPIHAITKHRQYADDYYQVYRADNPADSALVSNPRDFPER